MSLPASHAYGWWSEDNGLVPEMNLVGDLPQAISHICHLPICR